MFFKLFFLKIQLKFMSKSKFRRVYYDVCDKNQIELLNILIESKFFDRDESDIIIQPLYNAIDRNNIDVFRSIIENTRFFIKYDYENKNLIDYTINKSKLDLFIYLYDHLYLNYASKIYILTSSIARFNFSNDNKLIFDYLCDKIEDIQYDDFIVLKNVIYYDNEYAFDKLIQKKEIENNFSRLKSVLYYCVTGDNLRYLKKLVDLNIFNVGFENNYLLMISIGTRYDLITSYLLDQEDVICEKRKASLYKSLEICIKEHNEISNKIIIFKKILSLDFIDISWNSNALLISAIEYGKNEIVELLLSVPKINLSEDNPKFSVINYADDKLIIKLVNIENFRKYIDPYKEYDIRPKYNPKKIIRTIDE